MHRSSIEKKRFIFLVSLLLIMGLGIGYAILSETLTISNYVNYGSMKWDIGFDQVVDMSDEENLENIQADVVISADKKSMSLTCDLGSSTRRMDCFAVVTVKNNSSFDVMLDSLTNNFDPDTDEYCYDSEIVDYDNYEGIRVGNVLSKGDSITLLIMYSFKELTADLLPSKGLSLSYEISMNWVQTDGPQLINFTIDGVTYEGLDNMYWEDWVESDYNTNSNITMNYDDVSYGGYAMECDDFVVRGNDRLLDGVTCKASNWGLDP